MKDCLAPILFLVVIFGAPLFLALGGDKLPQIKNCKQGWYPKTEIHCD